VTVYRENVYFCNLVGFEKKANTLVRINGKIRSLVLSLLIKHFQILYLWTEVKFGPNHVKNIVFFSTLCLGIASFLYNSFFFYKYYILSRFRNVDRYFGRAQQLVS